MPLKWEYRFILTYNKDYDICLKELNEAGGQGWEAINWVEGGRILLKRQKSN